jgi:TusE/DsrC/DsvC family sulfur relay protein
VGYILNGEELEVDDDGFLLEANFSEEIVPVIAEAENIKLTDEHWQIINYMRRKYQEDGHTPNFRNMWRNWTKRSRASTGRRSSMNSSPCSPTARPPRSPA